MNDIISTARGNRAESRNAPAKEQSNSLSVATTKHNYASAFFVKDKYEGAHRLLRLLPEHIEWINGSQRQFSTRRAQTAMDIQMPYIAATRDIAGKTYAMDGSMVLSAFTRQLPESKLFSAKGEQWIHRKEEVSFWCLIGDAVEPLGLGTYQDLLGAGLSQGTIALVLGTNRKVECLKNENQEEQEDDKESKSFASSELDACRVCLFSLLMTGKISEPKPQLAQSLITNMDKLDFDQAMLNESALSAAGDMIVLDAALLLGIDLERKAKSSHCFPLSWATIYGNRSAVEKILERTKNPGADHEFLRTYPWRCYDEELRTWVLQLPDLSSRQTISRP